MLRLPIVSKADLLRVWARLGSAPGMAECAAILGFQLQTNADPQPTNQRENMQPGPQPQPSVTDPQPLIQYEFPPGTPGLPLWSASVAETLLRTESAVRRGNPISDQELGIRYHQPRLKLKPMIPWRRICGFLRGRLGTNVAGSQIDTDRLIRQLVTARPIDQIPRLLRRTWSPRIVLLVDSSREFQSFAKDVDLLVKSLIREAGKSAVSVITVSAFGKPPAVSPDIPVLALSCMGLYAEDWRLTAWWSELGTAFSETGHTVSALCPVPARLIPHSIQRTWRPQVWDIGIVPGRKKRLTSSSDNTYEDGCGPVAADMLLNLLATAPLVEPALLRAVRRTVRRHRPDVDVRAEWMAWENPDCWRSLESFGVKSGEPVTWRLENRALLHQEAPTLVRDVQALIDQQHSAYSCALQLETELRSWNERQPQQQTDALKLLQQVIDRLRQLALTPNSSEGTSSGLPKWFNDMIQRLPAQVCSRNELAPLIAEGLALTDTWWQQERTLPEGVCVEQYRQQLQAAAHRLEAGQPLHLDVGLQGSMLVLKPVGQSLRPWWPLGQLHAVARRHLTVSIQDDAGTRQLVSRLLESGVPERISLPTDARSLQLETPASRLQLHKISRPTWAQRFWQDQWGLAAEFRIGNVPFVMRWIPPGRFLMGSPQDENGRDGDEGPQHEVTISQGYWLGQTPVTQQQWAAVVRAEGKSKLTPKPSHFSGKPDHPVESVTWHKCVEFCQLVQGQLGSELTFRLPSEAEWEYACRAGTTGAYHDGSACTQPEGKDPALDRLGCFFKNSGGSTKPVGLKACNNWGLYDMHGNVWEWCRDTKRLYTPEARVDPFGPGSSGASRVLRGGGWNDSARYCRAAYRIASVPGNDWNFTGLRLSAGPSGFSGGAGDL